MPKMIKFSRFSIALQTRILLGMVLGLAASVLYFWAVDNGIAAEVEHSKTAADFTDSFRAMTSAHGGIYIRAESEEQIKLVGRHLTTFRLESTTEAGLPKTLIFHQKNPFLALGDLSNEVYKSPSKTKFRMASDNPMNPANATDAFEQDALEKMRAEGLQETWKVVGDKMRYARALIADQSCLKCHDTPSNAPFAVRTQYPGPQGTNIGTGYGYKVGDIVGTTSVSVPHRTPIEMLLNQGAGFWVSAVTFMALMILVYWGIISQVVAPMNKLSRYAHNVSERPDHPGIHPPSFDNSEESSSNEVHNLSHQLKALHESMIAAMRIISAKK